MPRTARSCGAPITIPGDGEPGHDTWQGDDWKTGGGSAWMTGNYDKDTKTIYWGVGNAAPWPGETHPGDNLYTSSVLALDPDTGKIKTYFQYHQNDSWDWDEVEAPMLIDLQRDGRTIKSLVHPGRDAIFWVLERTPTKINYVAGWPFVHTDVWKGIDAESGRPIVDPAHKPVVGKRVEFCPSLWGGKDWPSAAYSQKTGLVYVPANENFCGGFTGEKVPLKRGRAVARHQAGGHRPERRSPVPIISANCRPGIPPPGKKVWQHNFPKSQLFGSVTATAGDLVFVGGTNDRNFRAFNAKTGELLWEQKTNSGIMGMPVSYEIDGTQYIAIQSGWGVDAQRIQDALATNEYRHRSQRAAGRRDLGVRAEEISSAGGSKEAERQGANAADGNVRRILRVRCSRHEPVMPGLVPGIHVLRAAAEVVDGRDKPGHDCDGVRGRSAGSLLPLPLDLVLFLLVHLLNLRIGLCCPVVWVVEGGGALALGSEFWSGAVGRVAVVGGVVLLWANAPWPSKERRSTATRLRAPLRSCGHRSAPVRSMQTARGRSVFRLTPPIACRAEGCGCVFRSRRRSRSSAPARTAARRARRRRSAACRVRAARCRRWSQQGTSSIRMTWKSSKFFCCTLPSLKVISPYLARLSPMIAAPSICEAMRSGLT